MRPSLRTTMACYAGLAALAQLTLDGIFRVAVFLILAVLALKTWIASRGKKLEKEDCGQS